MKKIILLLICSSFLFLNNVSANESEISKSISEFIKLQSQDINEEMFEVGDCTSYTNGTGASINATAMNYYLGVGSSNYLALVSNKRSSCGHRSEETFLKNNSRNNKLPDSIDKINYSFKVYFSILDRKDESPYLNIDNEHLMFSKLNYCYSQANSLDFLKFCLYDFAKRGEYYLGWNINKNNENQAFYSKYEAWVKSENKLNEYFRKIDELMPKLYNKFKNDTNKIADFGDKIKKKIDSTNNENNKRILEYIRNDTLKFLTVISDYNFFVDRYDLEIKSDFLRKPKLRVISTNKLSDEDREEVKILSQKLLDLNLTTVNSSGQIDIHPIFKESPYYWNYHAILNSDYNMRKLQRIEDYKLKYNLPTYD